MMIMKTIVMMMVIIMNIIDIQKRNHVHPVVVIVASHVDWYSQETWF